RRDYKRRSALPPRVRIKATTQQDHRLAHRLIDELNARRAIEPNGPPIDVVIKYGHVSLLGNVESPTEHTRVLDSAETLRRNGAADIHDGLKIPGPYPYRY